MFGDIAITKHVGIAGFSMPKTYFRLVGTREQVVLAMRGLVYEYESELAYLKGAQ